ncbi:MAG TPA: ABC-type transport auxiliary lipoprotein family protein [bacterium]
MKERIVALAAAALLAGCAGLSQETRPTVWFAFEPALPSGGLRAGGPTIEVARFAGVAPFDSDRVATREAASRWAFAAYHRWAAPPGDMVAARLREALGRLDLFGAVFVAPAPIDADYRLCGTVRGLWWDRAARSAVIEVEVSLVGAQSRLLGFWVRRVAMPVGGDGVEDYLAAASKGLAQLTGDVGRDVAGAIAATAP